MKKHAYLIMAHGNREILKKQLRLLDDERNDFFVHLDKRMEISDEEELLACVSHSTLTFIERRYVFWADYTQTKCELDLIKAALCRGEYHYLHLLSGQDMPIKGKEYIHQFFEEEDRIFIHCNKTMAPMIQRRTRFYYPFIQTNCFRHHKSLKGISLLLGYAQGLLGINRHKKSGVYHDVYNGWNWFSIPADFARNVIENEHRIYKTFHHTVASDECFLQTVAMNGDFRARVNMEGDPCDRSLRKIAWNRGPYVFRKEDLEDLMQCPYLFARKFDANVDSEVIELIFERLQGEK